MEIIRGKIDKAIKTVIYGPEGIGKSTFASKYPDPLFIDTEDSTLRLNVARFKKPSSWTMLTQQIQYVKQNPSICKTLAIDTADWAERLCIEHICSKAQVKGIEDFGYGKGYVYLEEEFGRFLNSLQDLIELGIYVTVTAHAEIKKIEQPEEIGGYDHWQLKLEKKTMPLLKEWADLLIFANYKTMVINVDNQGAAKGKNKAQGNKRVMYTTRTPWWDAKNRYDLPEELPFDYSQIAYLFENSAPPIEEPIVQVEPPQQAVKQETQVHASAPVVEPETKPVSTGTSSLDESLGIDDTIPKALADLMRTHNVPVTAIQEVVGQRGYYPVDTPVANYDPGFIQGVLIGAWDQVYQMIKDDEIPF